MESTSVNNNPPVSILTTFSIFMAVIAITVFIALIFRIYTIQ